MEDKFIVLEVYSGSIYVCNRSAILAELIKQHHKYTPYY